MNDFGSRGEGGGGHWWITISIWDGRMDGWIN